MAPSASTGQEANPNVPRAIQLVMAMSGASPALTIGEQLRKTRMSRDLQWIRAVVPPSLFIVVTVGWCYKMLSEPRWWVAGFPWSLPVVMLLGTYLAVEYLILFLPQAPFAAQDVVDQVGFRQIGPAAIVASVPVFLLDQPWLHIASACLLGLLVAAVAFCVGLVRTYGKQDGQ